MTEKRMTFNFTAKEISGIDDFSEEPKIINTFSL